MARATIRDFAHDALQAITELPAPPVLVGHSLGALVVQRVLARYRAAPAAALLAPPPPRWGVGPAWQMMRHRPRQLLRAAVGRPVRLTGDDLLSDEVTPAERAALTRRLVPGPPRVERRLALPRRRRTAACPVLVLAGGADRVVSPHDAVATARLYGTRAVVFPGMGHDLMLEARWRQPLKVLLAWLDRTLGPAPV